MSPPLFFLALPPLVRRLLTRNSPPPSFSTTSMAAPDSERKEKRGSHYGEEIHYGINDCSNGSTYTEKTKKKEKKTSVNRFLTFSCTQQVDELRGKLEEKNKMIEKKTQAALTATQDKNRVSNELSELRDQVSKKNLIIKGTC